MPNWYGPFTAGEGAKRLFSVLNLTLALLAVLMVVSEFRYGWAERFMGQYLMSINASRPETGGIWESGRQSLKATQTLNRIITQKQSSLKAVQEADSFASLAQRLGPGEWVNLDHRQFKDLFDTLPAGSRNRLIGPARLVWLLTTGVVDRIFCEGQAGGLAVYFIDADNRVVFQLTLSREVLADPVAQAGDGARLDEMGHLYSRILPADRFFHALFQLPREMVPELMGNAGVLLKEKGTLNRVGIGDSAENGYIRLGFEFTGLEGPRVIQVQAREWAVWQLNLTLKGEGQ